MIMAVSYTHLDLPTHFIIASALKPSTVLCEQISSVYEERIGEWIGTLTPDEMKTLDQCLAVSIGIKADAQPAEDTESLRQKLATTEAKLAEMGAQLWTAESQRQTYKEMYEFLLSKQLGA